MPRIAIPKTRQELRRRRHLRVRNVLSGTTERPRLVVFRSLKHITAQIVDDTRGHTLLTVTDMGFEGKKSEKSLQVGKLVAERAKQAGIKLTATNPTTVVVDGADKEVVGQVAAELRGLRPPEPYKGKGVKYAGEQVRRKAGKAGGK